MLNWSVFILTVDKQRFTQTDWQFVIIRNEKHFSISVDLTAIALTHDAVKET